jgi:hypothetical protein
LQKTAALTETLKVQLSQEGENLVASLTESFEAANAKFREEFEWQIATRNSGCFRESRQTEKRH